MIDKLCKVYDDLLSKEEMDNVENYVESDHFPWHLVLSTTPNKKDFPFLSHMFIRDGKDNSSYLSLAVNLLQLFNEKSNNSYLNVLRAQGNLVFPCLIDTHSNKHIDTTEKHHVLIYYVNDSDGDTVMFNDNDKIIKRIPPKKGRFVLFDGSIYHAHFPCKKNNKRIVFNYNLKVSE